MVVTPILENGDQGLVGKVKFTVSQETTETDGKKGLVLQTDSGQWRIVFDKNGESFGAFNASGRQFGGFTYVSDTHNLQPEDYQTGF